MIPADTHSDDRPVTWIIVADASRARVLEPAADRCALAETDFFERVEPPDAPDAQVAPGVPWIGASRDDAFAQAISRYLDQARSQGRFSRLILVAPSPMLHVLHRALTPALRAMVKLVAETDLIDAEPGAILACLPGGFAHSRRSDA